MRSILALAALAAIGAPVAFAQDGQGSLRLLNSAPSAAVVETPPVASAEPVAAAAPPAEEREPLAHESVTSEPEPAPAEMPAAPVLAVAVAPAPVAPSRVATGWKGPVSFAPIAVVDLVARVCRTAASGNGGDLEAQAVDLGLGAPQPAPDQLARALPPGALTWQVPSTEGVLYLFGYGETPLKCGAAVVRPMPEEGFNKVFSLLQAPEQGYVSDSSQNLPGDIRWARLRSQRNEFVDVMEYPQNGDAPGVLRADFLPH